MDGYRDWDILSHHCKACAPHLQHRTMMLIFFIFFFILYFKVRNREPDVAHRTVGVYAWPESTGGCGVQPNLDVIFTLQQGKFKSLLC